MCCSSVRLMAGPWNRRTYARRVRTRRDAFRSREIRWRATALWALSSTVFVAAGLIGPTIDAPIRLIAPGSEGPSADIIREDFPEFEFRSEVGHDGQQTYAIARNPWNLDDVAPHLDRPTYRLGRPLLPWLGWALHPSGGGTGLVWALAAVEIVAVFGFAVAGGALVQVVGGRPQLAGLFALLPGTMAAVAITTSDVLAVALLAAAIAASLRSRSTMSAAFGALAIFAKESVALPFGIFLLVKAGIRAAIRPPEQSVVRTFARAPEVATGAAALIPWLLWSAWLRVQLGAETRLVEFGFPFGGLIDGWHLRWSQGEDLAAFGTVSATFALAVWAIVRGRKAAHIRPLWWALIAQLTFTSTFQASVIALDYNGPRTTLPLLLLAIAVAVGSTQQPHHPSAEKGLSPPRPTPA